MSGRVKINVVCARVVHVMYGPTLPLMPSTSLWCVFIRLKKYSEQVFKCNISGGAMFAFRKVPLKLCEGSGVKPSKTFAFVNF